MIEPWVAYGAAIWALIFAAFHIIWAAGYYPLLDAEQARIAFAVPWKWTYDVVVAAMCVIAVPVALAPVMSWGQYLPRLLIFRAWVLGVCAPSTSVEREPCPGRLSHRDRSLYGNGPLGALVLSRRGVVQSQHLAIQARTVDIVVSDD